MTTRDAVFCGDGKVGNYVVGFFPTGKKDDGEGAEARILRAYRALKYMNIRAGAAA
jgi:hypothetical protein